MTIPEIIALAAKAWNSTPDAVLGKKRANIRERRLAMYLARALTDLGYEAIGEQFGRDHKTVIYACRVMERALLDNPDCAEARVCREVVAEISQPATNPTP